MFRLVKWHSISKSYLPRRKTIENVRCVLHHIYACKTPLFLLSTCSFANTMDCRDENRSKSVFLQFKPWNLSEHFYAHHSLIWTCSAIICTLLLINYPKLYHIECVIIAFYFPISAHKYDLDYSLVHTKRSRNGRTFSMVE